MTEYINKMEALNKLQGRKTIELIQDIKPSDVIERSEYEKLRLVNLDLAETNKGLLTEHEQLLKLHSKIDEAIEEIEQASFNHYFELGEYIGEQTEQWKIVKLDVVLEILKRNIGE